VAETGLESDVFMGECGLSSAETSRYLTDLSHCACSIFHKMFQQWNTETRGALLPVLSVEMRLYSSSTQSTLRSLIYSSVLLMYLTCCFADCVVFCDM